MTRRPNWFFPLVLLLATNPVAAAEVRIASAANFTAAMNDIARLFEQQTGYRTRISYGSTGKLYTQIKNGAPFDIFLAADSERPMLAERNQLAVPDTRNVYAYGKLMLCSSQHDLSESGEDWLKNASAGRLAIANPKTAPYGRAARQVLEKLGLWDSAQDRIVRGDSIAQTFQFVATGNVEAGFVAASQSRNWKQFKDTCWQVPADYHMSLEQSVVLLMRGADNPAALALLKFFSHPAVESIILAHGYGTCEESKASASACGQQLAIKDEHSPRH